MPENSKEELVKTPERSSGYIYIIIFFVALALLLFGLRSGGQELKEIFATAMTLCLSCIGLGEINFTILGWIGILFVVFMIAYLLFGGRNARKIKI